MNSFYEHKKWKGWCKAFVLLFLLNFTTTFINAQDCPTTIPGFVYIGEYGGNHYFCSDGDNFSWSQAVNGAAAYGGHLAVINDAGENSFIQNQILADYAWIGYTDEDHEGNFDWVNNESDSYTRWASGEPNDGSPNGGHADYTVIGKSDGRWYDRNGNDHYEYVVEIPCSSFGNECQSRTVSNSKTNYGSGHNYGFYADNLVHGTLEGRRYAISNTSFKEYDNGTATFTALAINNDNSNIRFAINVNLSGRTLNTPSGSPQSSSCYSIDTGDWYYYTNLSGTATGLNHVAGGAFSLSLKDDIAFQVGTGANLNDENEFGGSSWIEYQVITHPTSGSISFNHNVQMDFNIRLSGDGGDPCDACVGAGGDSDGDGVCDNDDCAPNNAAFPMTPGTACNDGNPNTVNDVIQGDGCICAGTIDPCFAANVSGGQLLFSNGSNEATICVDNTPDPLNILLTGENGSNQAWIITDENLNILALPAAPPFDLNGAGVGVCLIWNVSFEDLQGAAVGENAANLTGCYELSNSIKVIREQCNTCENVEIGGIIGFGINCDGAKTICENEAVEINGCAAPEGGTGDLEIVWLRAIYNPNCYPPTTTLANIDNDPLWSIVTGETDLSLSAGTITENTCYLRCSRRAGCDTYIESNIVKAEYDPSPNCGGSGADCNNIGITAGNGEITITNLDGSDISSVMVFNAAWGTEFSCAGNCNATETISVPNGTYYVYAKYFDASWQPICEKNETVTVSGGGSGTTPSLSINDIEVNEDAGTTTMQICLSAVSTEQVAVDFGTNNGTAVLNQDFTALLGTALIPAGQLCVDIIIPIEDDLQSEPTEEFYVDLSDPVNATIDDGRGVVTIIDNDGGGTGDPDCADISISTSTGEIIIAGLNLAPVSSVQVFNTAWGQEFSCTGNCYATETINLADGTYYVSVKYYTAGWSPICEIFEEINVGGGNNGPCGNQGGDSDGDSICDDDDCQPNNSNYPATTGSICNDGNPNTENDMVTADGCGCTGTPTGGGNPDCETDVTITTSAGTISVTGLDGAPVTSLQVFNSSWGTEYACTGDCNAMEDVTVPSGTYYVYVKYYTAGWQPICQKEMTVEVSGGTDPCDTNGGDSDGDGVCDNQDCAPNNSALPATPGASCNDGDPNTENDVVGTDGCSCAGTPITPDVCVERDASNAQRDCGAGDDYGFYASNLITGTDAGVHYTVSNATFTEYADGTAQYHATATNSDDDGVEFDLNITLSGRTSTAPVGSPKESNCYDIAPSDWYYYTSLSGTATGLGDVAGGAYNVSLKDDIAFQVGVGANLRNELGFGASSWLDYSVVSQPTANGVTLNDDAQMDINIQLSGDAGDPCSNNGGGNNGGGATGSCDDITCNAGLGEIQITGLGGVPVTSLFIFTSTWSIEYQCFENCPGDEFSIPVPAGTYYVYAKLYNANYELICETFEEVAVANALAANSQFDFEVVKEEEHAELIWMHDQGDQVESYIIERSFDGNDFSEMIANYPSKGGTNAEVYHAYDFAPATGDNYYRVKMMLTSGNVEYSDILKINYADLIDFSVFPNPANQFTKLNLESLIGKKEITVTVFNNLGTPVQSVEIDQVYSKYYQLDIRDLKEGHYILWLNISNHKPIAKQLVVGKI